MPTLCYFAVMTKLLLIILMATCGNPSQPQNAEDVVRDRPAPAQIIRVSSRETVSENEMLADLAHARIVYLGERHGEMTDHAMQHRLITLLHANDSNLGIGFEMFQTPFQEQMDDWSAGRMDETALRRETEWDARWGFDYRLYRPIMEFIRARHIPAFALNAPQELTRQVARDGLAGLTEEQRESLPVLRLDVEAHRALVIEALGEHADDMPAARLENMYAAQVIWDETMARGIREALEGPDAPSRLLVLAGVMHIQSGLGIPDRVGDDDYRSVIVVDAEDTETLRSLLESTPPAATYIWVAAPPDLDGD